MTAIPKRLTLGVGWKAWNISLPLHCTLSLPNTRKHCQARLLQRESSKKYLYLFRICMGHIDSANLFSQYSKTGACVNNPIEMLPLCLSYQICDCNRGQSPSLLCFVSMKNELCHLRHFRNAPVCILQVGAALRWDGSRTPLSYNSMMWCGMRCQADSAFLFWKQSVDACCHEVLGIC